MAWIKNNKTSEERKEHSDKLIAQLEKLKADFKKDKGYWNNSKEHNNE